MRCGPTGKIIFKTHTGALIRAGEILENKGNRRYTPNEFRAYQCEFCGFYHLTGKQLRDPQYAE
jgi:hypothetical protein